MDFPRTDTNLNSNSIAPKWKFEALQPWHRVMLLVVAPSFGMSKQQLAPKCHGSRWAGPPSPPQLIINLLCLKPPRFWILRQVDDLERPKSPINRRSKQILHTKFEVVCSQETSTRWYVYLNSPSLAPQP